MTNLNEFFLYLGLLGGLAVLCAIASWFMFRRPDLVESLQTREYLFWAKLVSPNFSQKMKSFEDRMQTMVIAKCLMLLALTLTAGGFLFFSAWFVWAQYLPHK